MQKANNINKVDYYSAREQLCKIMDCPHLDPVKDETAKILDSNKKFS